MNTDLKSLNPKSLWKHFESLTKIPRPSRKEAEVIEFMKKFGNDLGLETIEDEVGNVIIKKPATPGMENRRGVILQGHLDMVPQANSDKDFNFETDPIEAYIDGEWVTANGTTLGADNGMGVAAAMAVLEATDLEHGPVEALFTVDEETGMTGAFGLKTGVLDGDILLNMDSEDEGELYIGCAGGINATARLKYTETPAHEKSVSYKITVSGLKGGHSGIDIPLYRGNANKLLFRLFKTAAKDFGLKIAEVHGGSLRNAIPREAHATVTVCGEHKEAFAKFFKEYDAIVRSEYSTSDPDLKLTCKTTEAAAKVMDEASQTRFTNAIIACPNGVVRMSNDMEGLVETSTNLAVVTVKEGVAEALSLLRSSVDSAKDDLASMVSSVFDLAGAETILDGDYPGWKPNPDSAILKEMKEIYNNKFGKIPDIKAIHAGLECGLLGGVYPNWDMISFGPTIRFPHSPDEKVNIATVEKFWDFLVETLKHVPKK
jgi:dipeptidase D